MGSYLLAISTFLHSFEMEIIDRIWFSLSLYHPDYDNIRFNVCVLFFFIGSEAGNSFFSVVGILISN